MLLLSTVTSKHNTRSTDFGCNCSLYRFLSHSPYLSLTGHTVTGFYDKMTILDTILQHRFSTLLGQVKLSYRTVYKHVWGSLVCFVVKPNHVNNNRYVSLLSFHWHTHTAFQEYTIHMKMSLDPRQLF